MTLHINGYGITHGYKVASVVFTENPSETQNVISEKLMEMSKTYDAAFRVEMHRQHTVESFNSQVNEFLADVMTQPKYGNSNIGIWCDEHKQAVASLLVNNQYVSLIGSDDTIKHFGEEISSLLKEKLGVDLELSHL